PGTREPHHLCNNRGCENVAHMELVPHRENVLLGTSPAAQHAKKTRCPAGHEYTHVRGGQRKCRACEEEQARVRWAQLKAFRRPSKGPVPRAQVEQIRALAGTKTQHTLAMEFGVAPATIRRILHGERRD